MNATLETKIPINRQEASEFSDQLDQDASKLGFGRCTRARKAREALSHKDAYFGRSPGNLELLFNGLTAVCCGCHKVGSYELGAKAYRRRY